MKKVTGFKTSDGQFFEDEAIAKAHEGELKFIKLLSAFVERTGTYEGKAQIFHAINDNREELQNMLNELM